MWAVNKAHPAIGPGEETAYFLRSIWIIDVFTHYYVLISLGLGSGLLVWDSLYTWKKRQLCPSTPFYATPIKLINLIILP